MVGKPAPLETFLNSTSSHALPDKPAEDAPDDTLAQKDRPSAESLAAAALRSVILTILSEAAAPVREDELESRSELTPDWFKIAVDDLQRNDLIAATESGYVLTAPGHAAAEVARARILNLG